VEDLVVEQDLLLVVDLIQEEQEILPLLVLLKEILVVVLQILVELDLWVVAVEVEPLEHQEDLDQEDVVELDHMYQMNILDQQLQLMEHQDQYLQLDILLVVEQEEDLVVQVLL
tara:strand:+ start:22 stop:363 length:342 start_codon:yes stop_codon:yes gene_type:complete